jgi:acyl-CoA thioester hydrolase
MSHTVEIRVRYHETDKMGVANHISHFRWFEVGRAELLREMKLSMLQLEAANCFLVLKEAKCVYESPAWYDDKLAITTKIAEVRSKAVRFEYVISRDAKTLACGHTVHVFTDGAGKKKDIPEKFRKRFEAAVEI